MQKKQFIVIFDIAALALGAGVHTPESNASGRPCRADIMLISAAINHP
jgi:hypothetical protein